MAVTGQVTCLAAPETFVSFSQLLLLLVAQSVELGAGDILWGRTPILRLLVSILYAIRRLEFAAVPAIRFVFTVVGLIRFLPIGLWFESIVPAV